MSTRTLTWVSPGGTVKTVTIGGRRAKPVSSRDRGTEAKRVEFAESLDDFMEVQRQRVAQRLQRVGDRIAERLADGMTRQQVLAETVRDIRR